MYRCSILVIIILGGEAMTGVRYKIPMLSAKAILAYANRFTVKLIYQNAVGQSTDSASDIRPR